MYATMLIDVNKMDRNSPELGPWPRQLGNLHSGICPSSVSAWNTNTDNVIQALKFNLGDSTNKCEAKFIGFSNQSTN